MTYIWEAGKQRTVMHIARYSQTGKLLYASLCGTEHNYNRAINAPFALGRKVCKRCTRITQFE